MDTRLVGHERPHTMVLQAKCATVDSEDGWQCPEQPVVRARFETDQGHRFTLDLCEGCWQEQEEDVERCADCGRPHRVNTILPDDVWTRIAPEQPHVPGAGGVLCLYCIDERCHEAGIVTGARLYWKGKAVAATTGADDWLLERLRELAPDDQEGGGAKCLGCGEPMGRDFRHTFCEDCDVQEAPKASPHPDSQGMVDVYDQEAE